VAAIIIPNQTKVVAMLRRSEVPDAWYGKVAKQRSLHNNYLTLPVVFFMLSIHYPLAFASAYNWVIAALIFLEGVLIRHWFNTRHARRGNPHWTWGAAVAIFLVIAWLSSVPRPAQPEAIAAASAQPYLASEHFAAVRETVLARCSMCHTTEPLWEGVLAAPKDVRLDSDAAIANAAHEVAVQAGYSHAMPPGNVTEMTEAERALIVVWYGEGSGL
jgi:uncharacterized membrane protein